MVVLYAIRTIPALNVLTHLLGTIPQPIHAQRNASSNIANPANQIRASASPANKALHFTNGIVNAYYRPSKTAPSSATGNSISSNACSALKDTNLPEINLLACSLLVPPSKTANYAFPTMPSASNAGRVTA